MCNQATHFKQAEFLGQIRHNCNRNCNKTVNTYKQTSKPINIPQKGSNLLPFIIPFHRSFLPLKEILQKYWYIIDNDPTLKDVFPNKPFISFIRHQNIHDYLIRIKLYKG